MKYLKSTLCWIQRGSLIADCRIFGVTTLDILRANTFVSQVKNISPAGTNVTVVGGHSGPTILPILSNLKHKFTDAEREALVQRIQ